MGVGNMLSLSNNFTAFKVSSSNHDFQLEGIYAAEAQIVTVSIYSGKKDAYVSIPPDSNGFLVELKPGILGITTYDSVHIWKYEKPSYVQQIISVRKEGSSYYNNSWLLSITGDHFCYVNDSIIVMFEGMTTVAKTFKEIQDDASLIDVVLSYSKLLLISLNQKGVIKYWNWKHGDCIASVKLSNLSSQICIIDRPLLWIMKPRYSGFHSLSIVGGDTGKVISDISCSMTNCVFTTSKTGLIVAYGKKLVFFKYY
jgi:hypothetical protein